MAIPVPEKRIASFEKRGFGMFIHWGLYSQLGQGEWIMNMKKIPKEEYSKLMDTFTAEGFDAEKIAHTAKKAGMRYITLTTRHHDGFSLYDTCGLCDYDAPHSPCGRDLVREFVDACRKEDILPMFYHTTLDWYQESFEKDFSSYLQYLRNSVEVLCTQYGPIGGLWFDGNWSKPKADWEESKLYETIRRHQPDAMIINNTGLSSRGEVGNLEIDSVTFEQGRPTPLDREGMPKYVAAEMCETLNDHWGFGAADFHYKSLPFLIESLCACRKVGANYLLNVGPDGTGEIPPLQRVLIESVGQWIQATGDALYDGKPCEIKGEDKNFALRRGDKAYLYVHDLTIVGDANVTLEGRENNGMRRFCGVSAPVVSVKWTDNGEALDFTQDKDGTLHVMCTGYNYGQNLVVRVAEVTFAS